MPSSSVSNDHVNESCTFLVPNFFVIINQSWGNQRSYKYILSHFPSLKHMPNGFLCVFYYIKDKSRRKYSIIHYNEINKSHTFKNMFNICELIE